jgi:hypothetical protein
VFLFLSLVADCLVLVHSRALDTVILFHNYAWLGGHGHAD